MEPLALVHAKPLNNALQTTSTIMTSRPGSLKSVSLEAMILAALEQGNFTTPTNAGGQTTVMKTHHLRASLVDEWKNEV